MYSKQQIKERARQLAKKAYKKSQSLGKDVGKLLTEADKKVRASKAAKLVKHAVEVVEAKTTDLQVGITMKETRDFLHNPKSPLKKKLALHLLKNLMNKVEKSKV